MDLLYPLTTGCLVRNSGRSSVWNKNQATHSFIVYSANLRNTALVEAGHVDCISVWSPYLLSGLLSR